MIRQTVPTLSQMNTLHEAQPISSRSILVLSYLRLDLPSALLLPGRIRIVTKTYLVMFNILLSALEWKNREIMNLAYSTCVFKM